MAATGTEAAGPQLERLNHDKIPGFTVPSKRINDGDDLSFFLSSTAYRDLMTWVLQLNRAVFPIRDDTGHIDECKLDSPPTFSSNVQSLRSLIADLEGLIKDAPPDTGPRRFGNVAFRTWFKLAEQGMTELVGRHLRPVLHQWGGQDQQKTEDLRQELEVYLLGSFGSAQRLDYGTGHELSFLAFLGCLWKLGTFEAGEERAIVVGLIQPYIMLIRTLVQTYTLEPAGSHGVWGLDDHSFVPYIFGSAQLGPAITSTSPTPTEGSLSEAPQPSSVTEKRLVADYKDSNMYFAAVQFIYDVKRGPFWEHSPVLYDVSGIKDGWGKINKGMLKMYAAEVLGKFPVVQHFPFGSLFRWEADPAASAQQNSVHSQNQPARSMDVPPAPTSTSARGQGAGTKASWADPGTTAMPAMQSATGMPSTRAPWAGNSVGRPSAPNMPPTAAPWAATNRHAQSNGPSMPSTTAPWSRKNDSSR